MSRKRRISSNSRRKRRKRRDSRPRAPDEEKGKRLRDFRENSKWDKKEISVDDLQAMPTFSSTQVNSQLLNQDEDAVALAKDANELYVKLATGSFAKRTSLPKWLPVKLLYTAFSSNLKHTTHNAAIAQAATALTSITLTQQPPPPIPSSSLPVATTLQSTLSQNYYANLCGGQVTPIQPPIPVNNPDAKKVYVGNLLTGTANADNLTEFFTKLFKEIPEAESLPQYITSCTIAPVGTFGFLEFATEKLASTALLFSGIRFLGRLMQVGRPTKYIPTGIEEGPYDVSPLRLILPDMPTQRPNPNDQSDALESQLFIGNLPTGQLTEANIEALFTPACSVMSDYDPSKGPPVVKVNIAPAGTYAFVQFQNPQITTTALEVFDKMEIGGRHINVGRPQNYFRHDKTPKPPPGRPPME